MSTSEPSQTEPVTAADCPLSRREQTRNVILYGCNIALVYLGAPVLYVGITHAALIKRLGASDAASKASDTISSLPGAVYLWMTPLPVLFAWYFCRVRQLKNVLVCTYLSMALAGAAVAAILISGAGREVSVAALIVHGGLLGCGLGIVNTFQWEVIGRGVSESRRGQALALAFGAGPVLAFLSSMASQLVLTGSVEVPWFELPLHFKMVSLSMRTLAFPWNFAALFAATAGIMAVAAALSGGFVVPQPEKEPARPAFVSGVFGGFLKFLSRRLILLAVIANILVYAGYTIITNISNYTPEAIGEAAEKYAGYQNALRFGFKIVAGFLLGWILTRWHPKAGLLATCAVLIGGVAWVIAVPAMDIPAKWFLLSFGILGAGELFGVYYPNYILSCSPKSEMRRNMAFCSLITMPAGFAPIVFGLISDNVSYRASFLAAIGLLSLTFLFVLFALPARPRPHAGLDDY